MPVTPPKNVVLQYMIFPLAAPERVSLVPVIGMLLQFAPDEQRSAMTAAQHPNFTSRPVKEIMASMAALAQTKVATAGQASPRSSSGSGSSSSGDAAAEKPSVPQRASVPAMAPAQVPKKHSTAPASASGSSTQIAPAPYSPPTVAGVPASRKGGKEDEPGTVKI
jgi:hypothetical protein